MKHDLKTWPVPFKAVRSGVKRFEIRKHDRAFKVGDTLRLREWSPVDGEYSGREMLVAVTYMLQGEAAVQFGCQYGYCIMGIRRVKEPTR